MAPPIQELTALVETQIGRCRDLKAVLAGEQKAATRGDTRALAEAVQAKQDIVAQIGEGQGQIGRLLARLCPAGVPATLSELAASLPRDQGQRLKQLAGTVKTEAADLQRINRANGEFMAHCLKRVNQSLEVLNHLLAPQLVYQPAGAPVHPGRPVHRFSQRA